MWYAANSIEEWCERELNSRKKARQAGVLAAVPDAIALCRKHGIAPPDWVLEDAEQLCFQAIKHGLPKTRGRTGSHLGRYRQIVIDFDRWDAVFEVRKKQAEIVEELKELRSMKSVPPEAYEDRVELQKWLGRSWDLAFRCAACLLRGTASQGSPDAIKKSYMRVQRESRDPVLCGKYLMLRHRTLHSLGLSDLLELPQGRKPSDIFDPAR